LGGLRYLACPKSFGSFATLAAIRRAPSLLSSFAADCPWNQSRKRTFNVLREQSLVTLAPVVSRGRGYFYLPKNNRKTPIVRNNDRGLSRAGPMEPARLMISESREGGTAAAVVTSAADPVLAKFEATRRASSLLSSFAAERRPGSSSKCLTWCISYQVPKVWT